MPVSYTHLVLNAYKEAVEERYRFFSFGDAMFITNDMHMDDEAGGIAVLASLLAFNGINIKNIGIINNREFEEGVLLSLIHI